MKKLIFTIVITFVALSFAVVFFFFWLQNKRETPSEAIFAIPIDASFILKINDYHRFSESLRTNNHLWDAVKQFSSVAKADSIIAFVDSLSNRSLLFNALISANSVYISTHTLGGNNIQFFATVKIPKGSSKNELFDLTELCTKNKFRIAVQEYNKIDISTIIDPKHSTELFYFCFFRGLAVCSSSINLIKSSINQLEKKSSLLNDPAFLSISHTAGTKVDVNLYINNSKIPVTFRKFFKQPYLSGINTFTDVAQWSELDVTIKEDALFLNGFTLAADTLNSYLKVFAHQRPIENKVASILPLETTSFICLGISNLDLFLEDYRLYLDHTDRILEYTSALTDCKKNFGIDIHDLYRSFFNKEIALFFSPFDGVDIKDCWYVAVKNNGASQTKQTFSNLIDTYVKSNKLKRSDFRTSFKVDSDKSFEIYKLPLKGVNQLLFGSLFSDVSDEYITFIDDYVIFGASKDALSKIILSNIHNKQLQLDVSFRQFSNVLASESNFFFYLNPNRSEKLFNTLLETQYANTLTKNHSSLSKIQGISLQLNGGSRMIFNNINFQYSPFTSEDPQTSWETRLDTALSMRPQVVINHVTKSQEIIAQDEKNKLYLLNDVGRILWTKQLPEQINGEITQVDLFRNEKMQYIFSTKSYIYAIDRKGDFVDGYPIKLISKATNPVSVFDYENSRDYRLFIACNDRKIYVFNRQGKPLSGWFFGKTEKIVINQLQHFRVKGKDYIVFADANRPYIVDRKGEVRISLPRFFSKSINSKFILDENSKNHSERLITTDSIGLIKFIYFNGKVEELAIKAFSSKHVFDYLDVDSDGEKEYVFLDNTRLYVYKNDKTLLFLYKFDTEIIPEILICKINNLGLKLGFVSSKSNEIYLINGNGSLYDGFPLSGCTLFSVGSNPVKGSNFNLITGSPSGMLFNYSVK
ncbi:MAG: DUF3352 domain-containing protein [Bacteroidales bacterium]|nr:DUF3352 domain-containing protein [Bacteroidales bacterium]